MPLAAVCAIHISASAELLAALRHIGLPVDHTPVTFVIVLPFMTHCATRPCWEAPQAGDGLVRPWLSALNQSECFASCIRFRPDLMPPPRLPKNRLSGLFSFAMRS